MLKACRLLQDKVEKDPEFKQFEKVGNILLTPPVLILTFQSKSQFLHLKTECDK